MSKGWMELLNDKDAALAQLREEVERLKAKLDRSHLYRNSSYWQEKAMAVLRGEFTQCCSYCGFEAQPPNGWEELQKHIEECPEHPLPKLRARLEAAEAAVGILQKSTVSLLARAEQAEKELAAERGKVEKAKEWLAGSIINYCPECSLEIDIIDWDALEQILEDK